MAMAALDPILYQLFLLDNLVFPIAGNIPREHPVQASCTAQGRDRTRGHQEPRAEGAGGSIVLGVDEEQFDAAVLIVE
jgi:hypothetical protein